MENGRASTTQFVQDTADSTEPVSFVSQLPRQKLVNMIVKLFHWQFLDPDSRGFRVSKIEGDCGSNSKLPGIPHVCRPWLQVGFNRAPNELFTHGVEISERVLYVILEI